MSSKPVGFSRPEDARPNTGKCTRFRPSRIGRRRRRTKKPPGIPAAFFGNDDADRRKGFKLEALGVLPAITTAAEAVLEATAPAFTAITAVAVVMGQHREPALLAVIERLVERVGRIGDLLQHSSGSRHVIGAPAQTRDRIGLRLIVGRLGGGSLPRRSTIEPALAEFAPRALDRGPQF